MGDIFTPESRFLTLDKFDRRMRELEKYRFTEMESLLPMTAMEDTMPSGSVHTEVPDVIEGSTIKEGDFLIGVDHYWCECFAFHLGDYHISLILSNRGFLC